MEYVHIRSSIYEERERERGILMITQTGWCTLHGSDQSLKWFSLGLNVLWFVSLQCSMIIRIGNLEYKSTTSNIYIYIIKNKSTTLYFSEDKDRPKGYYYSTKIEPKEVKQQTLSTCFCNQWHT